MAISGETPAGPAHTLGQAAGMLSALGEVLWAARTDAELVTTVEVIARLRGTLAAVEAGAVAEVEARGTAKRLGWACTADWVTHLGGLRRGAGRRVLRRAHALTTGGRDATRAALLAGQISPEQADLVCQAVEDLPGNPFLRRRGETHLLEQAARLDATDLARAGRHLVHVVDPDGTDRRLEAALERDERAAHTGRFLTITEDGAGGIRLKGRGSTEDGAILRAALLPLTRPHPTPQDDPDPGRDPRDHGARLWDALIHTAHHALNTQLPPTSHGVVPRVAVTLELNQLQARLDTAGREQAGLGAGLTEDGLRLSAAAVRRLACDAGIIPVILNTTGAVLDVGREHRLITPAIWQALVIRDQHCAFPTCTRPPVMCHAHHIQHWADHGPTSLHNLVLLCDHHHRLIHHTPWQIQIADNGQPHFHPPPTRPTDPLTALPHQPQRE